MGQFFLVVPWAFSPRTWFRGEGRDPPLRHSETIKGVAIPYQVAATARWTPAFEGVTESRFLEETCHLFDYSTMPCEPD
jgi:hypothetical protein